MGEPGAFLHVGREEHDVCDELEAVTSFDDFVRPLDLDEQETQASRCMDCGVAFCQSGVSFIGGKKPTGCPLHNPIPEMNDLLFRGLIEEAGARLSMTNPFSEFTGRVCPVPCEQACNLGLHDAPVTIRDNERAISDHEWEGGRNLPAWAEADASERANAPLVTVVGSGPAGLAAAWELASSGVRVRVLEKADRAGGLLMYGIPNMKLPKTVVDRRVDFMRDCGIEVDCGVDGVAAADQVLADSNAVVLACGFRTPRALGIPGEDLGHVRFAVDYLTEATQAYLAGEDPAETAAGKDVVVIGGGDTGVDCVATALRQGARSVHQIIRAAAPANDETANEQWTLWPNARGIQLPGYGQLEAAKVFGEDPRIWSTDTVAFRSGAEVAEESGEDAEGASEAAASAVAPSADGVAAVILSPKGSDETYEIPAQLVLIAKGFVSPEQDLFAAYGLTAAHEGKPVALTAAGTHHALSAAVKPVFVAGDFAMGSTLVATSIEDGLLCAREVLDQLGK